MRTTRTRTSVAALGLSLALALTACGDGDDPTVGAPAPGSTAPGSVDGISTEFNDADVTFINDMVPHHSGALDMALLAPERAGSDEVRDLAARIAAAQGPELEQMRAFAAAWGVELTEGGDMEGMDHSVGGMGGMDMGGGDVAALEPLSGEAFDQEFLVRMIAHHEGALPMAQAELDGGVNPQARELADEIITVQEAEIAEMQELLQA